METQDLYFVVSLTVGIVSVVLAIVAILFAKSTEAESRENYLKTREVLAEIDKRAEVTEKTVAQSHQQLLDTVTNLLNQTALPEDNSFGTQLASAFALHFQKNPEQALQWVREMKQTFGTSEEEEGGES